MHALTSLVDSHLAVAKSDVAAAWFHCGGRQPVIDDFWRDTQSRYKLLRGDKERPPLPPNELFLTSDLFFGQLKPYARIEIHSTVPNSKAEKIKTTSLLPAVPVNRKLSASKERLRRLLTTASLCAESSFFSRTSARSIVA